jgi:DNA polymerase elongation subunit (family B)
MKRILIMDIELYRNYFLVRFKAIDSGKRMGFEYFEGHPLDKATVCKILSAFTIVTFNGMNYDMSVLALALTGASNSDLKDASDRIIQDGLRGWQFEQYYECKIPVPCDHIDLCESVPGVMISLKLYGARMHSKRLQDLPIEHTALISPAQRPLLNSYCDNDLDTTDDLYRVATNPKNNIVETRVQLGNEFGMDLRSKSDAQIAEACIRSEVEERMGRKLYKQVIPAGTVFRYTAPAFLTFKTPALNEKLREILASEFVINDKGKVMMPPALSAKVETVTGDDGDVVKAPPRSRLTIAGKWYSMGIGGLHSMEKSAGHIGTPDVLLRDVDVVSYYPSLMMQCGLSPVNMGDYFQEVFKYFFDRRMAAKREGNGSVAQTLKIILNGTYGKLGSMYSLMYSPDLMIQVTVTGQLALLMMIERLEAAGIPVISANTDGVVSACPAHLNPVRLEIVKQWERETGLETEETEYRALFSRDVNNYCALKAGGGAKAKGVLVPPGVQKNPDNEIVSQAVMQFLDTGKPLAETILHCRDIRKFLRVKRVTGGAQIVLTTRSADNWVSTERGEWTLTNGTRTLKAKRVSKPLPVDVPDQVQYLGRVVRWYRRTGAKQYIEYVTSGNKVGGSDGACPVMDLPDSFPIDIDYNFYLTEANDLLRELGAMK